MKSELKIDTRVRSLRSYLDEFEKGAFQIPSFQRDFLWDTPAIVQLFDSIKNRYPIGSIQFWQPIEDGQVWLSNDIKIGPYKIRNQAMDSKPIFILDGLQRLSSLFGCLVNPDKYNKERLELDNGIWNEKFRVYYDLETEEFFSLRKNTQPKLYQLPLYVLINTSDFRKFSRENLEKISDFAKIDLYLDRADELSKVLSEYEIASVDVLNATVEEAVEIFWRVNKKGLEISKDWIVNALTVNNNFKLQFEIDNLIERLRIFNFSEINRDVLFNCIQSSFGKLSFDIDVVALIKRDRNHFINTAQKAISSIEKAVEFLFKEAYVIDSKILPTNWHLIFVTEFFNLLENPTENQKGELKRWFWFTTYSNYFTVNSPSKRAKAFIQFRNYLLGIENNLIFIDDENTRFSSPKYKYSTYGSVRFCSNVLFQLSQTSYNIHPDECLGLESIKMLEIYPKESLGNTIFIPIRIKDEILNYEGKKHTNVEFLLSNQFRGKYKELFITDEMRDAYTKKDFSSIIQIREQLIISKESEFVCQQGLGYEI